MMKQENKKKWIGIWEEEKQWKDKIYAMWQQIFQDPESFAKYYYDHMYHKNRIYTVWKGKEECEHDLSAQNIEERQLCGMLHLNPYEMKIGSKKKVIDYIVGVAVDETMRRQGIMASMLQESMLEMYRERKPFTFLMPAKEAYYKPFDFRFVFDRYTYEVERTSEKVSRQYQWVSYEKLENKEQFLEFCSDFFEDMDITTIRTKGYMEQLMEEVKAEEGDCLICIQNEKIKGFVTYALDGKKAVVREIVTKEPIEAIMQEFLTTIQCKQGTFSLDWFHSIPSEYKTIPTIMFRIVHMIEMLEMMVGKETQTLLFEVKDKFVMENNGVYCMELGKDGSKVEKVEEQKGEMKVSIAQLTSILFGYPSEEVTEELKQYFRNIIPLQKIYISEIV